MRTLPSRFIPYEMQTTLIKVLSYEHKSLKGYLVNPYFPDDVYFGSLICMLQLVEDMLDALGFPKRSMERRAFDSESGQQPVQTAPPEGAPQTPIATFKLRVLFRQNATWEGDLVWVDRRVSAEFRSVLELIGILDSALGGVYEQDG